MKNNLLSWIALLLIIMIILSAAGNDRFELEGAEVIGRVLDGDYRIPAQQIQGLEKAGKVRVIDLDAGTGREESPYTGSLSMPLKDMSVQTIHRALSKRSNVILDSEDPVLSARVWMLLSQMGYANVFILEREKLTEATDDRKTFDFLPLNQSSNGKSTGPLTEN
jgi:hypothetical protein